MLDQLDFGILSLISKFFTTPQFKTSYCEFNAIFLTVWDLYHLHSDLETPSSHLGIDL